MRVELFFSSLSLGLHFDGSTFEMSRRFGGEKLDQSWVSISERPFNKKKSGHPENSQHEPFYEQSLSDMLQNY